MTAIAKPRTTTRPFAGALLATSLLGVIAGGAIATAVPAALDARTRADHAAAVQARQTEAGRAWEARYFQMYPNAR
jgi:hypothetical protein